MPTVSYDPGNYMDTAFAPIWLANKVAVFKNTWGHLAPAKNRKYRGYIVFSVAGYSGTMEIIDAGFDGLEDSPWLFDAMNDFVFEDLELTPGAVYRFDGHFLNYKFKGTRSVLYTPPQISTDQE